MKLRARPDSPLRCALCHGAIALGDGWRCPGCRTRCHAGCAEATARCPTLGCRVPVRLVATAAPELALWWYRVRPYVSVALWIHAWVLGALVLDGLQRSWIPARFEPAPLWKSFVTVGVFLPAAVTIWRFRRDLYA